ncbi:MAG TPA: hypothetical protein VHX66_11155 [Solirubrobacteraceae bacterium]|jgi:hypothetical protein|nr:hypothetical protein [Solirubrobacteraceae bacterium]
MLAYVFWHRPADGVAADAYARLLDRFHRSLAARPPVGFHGSVTFAVPAPNWLGAEPAFEDWYVVDDFAALGVLNEAAIGRGHLSAHDAAARAAGPGTASIYRLLEGTPTLEHARVAVWIDKPRGVESPLLAALLGDGMDPGSAGLWQRQLALGPAPEYCVLAQQPPRGVAKTRLAQGWSATVTERAPI